MDNENAREAWLLQIERTKNGYILLGNDGLSVIEEDDQDELKEHEKLLWAVMEYFGFQGSKHDKQRLRVMREQQEIGIGDQTIRRDNESSGCNQHR